MAIYRVGERYYVKIMKQGIYYHAPGGFTTKEKAEMEQNKLKSRLIGRISNKYCLDYKEKALAHYTENGIIRCACCGESNIEFLTLDHINGGGHLDREKTGSGQKFYRYLIKHNFPKEFDLQILCFNCNCARRNGVCPHQRTKKRGII